MNLREWLKFNDLIDVITELHRKKFPVDSYTQERKFIEEMSEFQCATNESDKIEEACDVIISAIGFIDRLGKSPKEELVNKFEKVLARQYPDNFQHKD